VKKMKSNLPNHIDELMEAVESSLQLQGATANEDKLQPGVPDTIAQLARAGIRVWMVTGDKQETAVNIGFATKLLDDSMRQVCHVAHFVRKRRQPDNSSFFHQVVVTVDSAGSVAAAMKRLRIAAKRMAAERATDARAQATTRSGLRALSAWFDDRITALEKSLGFAVPESKKASQSLHETKMQVTYAI
jgi:magnesium-transporting ATPase (P-type)